MPPVNVLQLITRLIVGGAQETVMYTAELLDRSRFQVDVVSGPQTGAEGSLIEEFRNRGIPLVMMDNLVRQISPSRDFFVLGDLKLVLRKKDYSIVHTNSSKAGIVGRWAARRCRIPVVVHTVHGWSFHEHMSPLSRWFYIQSEKLAARWTDAFIVVTDRDIEKGLREGIGKREQYHLVRSALPLDEFDPERFDSQEVRRELGIGQDCPVLGNIGRFSPQKNPLDWVRVAGRVSRKLPRCRFLLVGDGPLREEVEKALEEEGIREQTVMPGLRRDVGRMLSTVDVFLLTSLWEGLPRTIPQALSMKIPVIANRADGTAEAIRDGRTGFLVEPGNLDEMAERCLELLKNQDKRQSFGQAGRKDALERFDIRQMIKQTEELYEQLLHQKGIRV